MDFLFSCLLSSSLLSFPSSLPFSSTFLSSLLYPPSPSSLPFSPTRLSSLRPQPPDAYVYVSSHEHSTFIKSISIILSTTLYNMLDKTMSLGEEIKMILSNYFLISDNTSCIRFVLIYDSKIDSNRFRYSANNFVFLVPLCCMFGGQEQLRWDSACVVGRGNYSCPDLLI